MGFWPYHGVEVGFQFGASDPFDTSTAFTWFDDRAMELTIKRGRSFFLDQFRAGTCQVTIENGDREFDPTYSSGSYFGDLLPQIQMRVRVRHQTGPPSGPTYSYDLFWGLTKGFPQSWRMLDTLRVSDIQAVDAFRRFARQYLSETFSQELSGDRVVNVLDLVGWPNSGSKSAQFRAIDDGISQMQGITLEARSALEHLHHVQQSEFGRLFVDGQGRVVFQDRHALLNQASSVTFGEDSASGEIQYEHLEMDSSDEELFTRVEVSAIGGTTQQVEDISTVYGYLDLPPRSNLLLTSDNEAKRMAEYLLDRLKDPYNRITQMVVNPLREDFTTWNTLMQLEIGDMVTVKRRPGRIGNTISQDVVIDGISHSIGMGQGDWRITYELTPADRDQYWELNSATLSELGVTTRLAF